MPTTASASTSAGATTASTAAMPSTATRSSPTPRVPASTNVSSAYAASTIMANHYPVGCSAYSRVTYKVLGVVIEANCSHIFRGCGVLLRQYATRHYRLDQPGFDQGLRGT